MRPLKYLSVCSGIEAATVAWHPLGWTPVAFSEIAPFPCAVLAHHYGSNLPGEPHSSNGVPNWGDMTNFQEWPDAEFDLLVGGTPCQSFSVAGLRKGLTDPRGNLALTFLGIAERYRPAWVLWENVPGVLSSNEGRDFGAFLGGVGELRYGWAYRVLDAQYVRVDGLGRAVPQRRRRVFVVGCLGGWSRAAAVLFERACLSGHPPPRREAGQGVARTLSSRTQGGGRLGTDFECGGGLVSAPLSAANQKGDHAGREGHLVAHALRGEGFDASEDGTGRGTPIVPAAFAGGNTAGPVDVSATLTGHGGRQDFEAETFVCDAPVYAMQERMESLNPDNASNGAGWRDDGAAYTMESRRRPQAVAFSSKDHGADADSETAPTLRAMGHDGSHANAGGQVAFAENSRGEVRLQGGDGQVAPQLNAGGGKPGQGRGCVATERAVRRLTETECERLQGCKDGYTQIPWRGKPAAKCPGGPRYKALGNSMAVNVMRWIGMRIDMVRGMTGEGE